MNPNTINQAHERIKSYLGKTPVRRFDYLDDLSGNRVFLKCENEQVTGAFKVRGVFNALLSLDSKPAGVVTRSSGNHGQGLVYAANRLGIPCHIVMPNTATEMKIKDVKARGATVEFCGPDNEALQEAVDRYVTDKGFVFVHAYNDQHIIAGQGTACMELMEEVPDLDIIITPLGGGGLLGGTALYAKNVRPEIVVYGVEPEAGNDGYLSLKKGEIVRKYYPPTMADGLRMPVGEVNFPILQKYVDDVLLVRENEILESVFMVYDKLNMVIEPSSAVVIAVLLFRKVHVKNKKIGLIISGGNLDIRQFSKKIAGNLQPTGA